MTHTPETLITRAEAAARAGVSVPTVDYWRRTDRLTTHKNDLGHVRVDADELDRLIIQKPVSVPEQRSGS